MSNILPVFPKVTESPTKVHQIRMDGVAKGNDVTATDTSSQPGQEGAPIPEFGLSESESFVSDSTEVIEAESDTQEEESGTSEVPEVAIDGENMERGQDPGPKS